MDLQDHLVDFDSLTQYKNRGLFTLEEHGVYPEELDGENLIFKVRIEMDQSLRVLERSYYSVLDLLADLGGLFSLLVSVFFLVMRKYRWYHMDSYLSQQLYTMKADNKESKGT